MAKFNPGDRVRCVESDWGWSRENGNQHDVAVGESVIVVEGRGATFDTAELTSLSNYRFELVTEPAPAPKDPGLEFLERVVANPSVFSSDDDYSIGYLDALRDLTAAYGKKIVTTTTRSLEDA